MSASPRGRHMHTSARAPLRQADFGKSYYVRL